MKEDSLTIKLPTKTAKDKIKRFSKCGRINSYESSFDLVQLVLLEVEVVFFSPNLFENNLFFLYKWSAWVVGIINISCKLLLCLKVMPFDLE